MSFRARLVVALAVIAVVPLILLVFVVRGTISTGIDSLAPQSAGESLQAGLTLAREQLDFIREGLSPTLRMVVATVPPPNSPKAPAVSPETLLRPQQQLFTRSGRHWHRLDANGWQSSDAPPSPRDAVFEGMPRQLQARLTDPTGREWVLLHRVDDEFITTAHQIQDSAADWAVSREQQSRLLVTLLAVLAIGYLVAVALSLIVALVMLRPFTRGIQHLTEVAERVREGDEQVRADSSGRGEIGRLARTFNLMLDGLADSRRHAAEMEKRAAWRELAPVLAHEIKNPLTPIQLSVQQLHDSYRGDDERYARTLATAREIVDEEIERLRKLVREFGDFARAPQPEPERVQIDAFVHDLAGLYGERLELATDAAPTEAVFDPEQLRRALVNLLDNAFAAAGDPAAVRLTVDPGVEQNSDAASGPVAVRFVIEDNGPGVPEEIAEKIFEPYMTTKSNGIGLGLPVVKSTVDEHGGRISLDRSPDLGGARFTVALAPVAPTG